MGWMVAAGLLAFGFGQLWKVSQRRGCHAPTVVAVNYLVIAATLTVFLLVQGKLHVDAPIARRGAMIGCFFVLSMLVMTRGLVIADVGPVLTSYRLSILVPIVAGVVIWHEELGYVQALGIALALVGLILMTLGPRRDAVDAVPHKRRALWIMIPVFLCQGMSHTGMRSVEYAGLSDVRVEVLLVIAAVAGLLGAVVVAVMRYRPTLRDLGMGAFIGWFNLVALYAILTALAELPGTLYYPITGCAIVILDNLAAHFFWKEKLTAPAIAGAALGALSMVLVNL